MGIVTKERSQLVRRESLTGDERLPINGYEYITPKQIAELSGGGGGGGEVVSSLYSRPKLICFTSSITGRELRVYHPLLSEDYEAVLMVYQKKSGKKGSSSSIIQKKGWCLALGNRAWFEWKPFVFQRFSEYYSIDLDQLCNYVIKRYCMVKGMDRSYMTSLNLHGWNDVSSSNKGFFGGDDGHTTNLKKVRTFGIALRKKGSSSYSDIAPIILHIQDANLGICIK